MKFHVQVNFLAFPNTAAQVNLRHDHISPLIKVMGLINGSFLFGLHVFCGKSLTFLHKDAQLSRIGKTTTCQPLYFLDTQSNNVSAVGYLSDRFTALIYDSSHKEHYLKYISKRKIVPGNIMNGFGEEQLIRWICECTIIQTKTVQLTFKNPLHVAFKIQGPLIQRACCKGNFPFHSLQKVVQVYEPWKTNSVKNDADLFQVRLNSLSKSVFRVQGFLNEVRRHRVTT